MFVLSFYSSSELTSDNIDLMFLLFCSLYLYFSQFIFICVAKLRAGFQNTC